MTLAFIYTRPPGQQAIRTKLIFKCITMEEFEANPG